MRAVVLAVRGIWWRRWASLAVLVVGIACAAIAASVPTFAAGSRDAVLQATLRAAPVDADGTGVSISIGTDTSATRKQLLEQVDAEFADLVDGGYLTAPVVAQQGIKGVFDSSRVRVVATVPFVAREDACAHVRMIAGSCVSKTDPFGIVVTSETAANRGWAVDSTAIVGNRNRASRVHVRGIYEPIDPDGAYWFGSSNEYFDQVAQYGSAAVPRTDAALVPDRFWNKVRPQPGDDVVASMDLALRPGIVHESSVDLLQALLGAASVRIQTPLNTAAGAPSIATELPAVLTRADEATTSVAAPILIIGVQLVVLTWLVLYLVLAGSAEGRSGEIVLGKLRGLTPRETILHALLEPLILVAIAVPAGVALCALLVRDIGSEVLGRYAVLSVPSSAWTAAIGAGLGGVVAAGIASVAVLRRSVVDQWRRTERRPGRSGWVLDAIIATLAVAGFLDLASASGSDPTRRFLPAAAPGLLAVAFALLGVRIVPLLARTAFRATRGSHRVAVFVALRQMGRRPADLRVFVLLTVAIGLFVFGLASRSVFDRNRTDRALTEVGADRVVTVGAPQGIDPSAVVAKLDPEGRFAAAVYHGPLSIDTATSVFVGASPTSDATTLVVDPKRFAAVAFWRGDFGSSASLADELRPLQAAPPAPVRIAATQLRLAASAHVKALLPVQLHVGLTTPDGQPVDVVLGSIRPTPKKVPATAVRFAASVPQCAGGCLLRRLSVLVDPTDESSLVATLAVTRFEDVDAAGRSHDLLAPLRASTWTSVDTNEGDVPAASVDTSGTALTVSFAPSYLAQNVDTGYAVVSDFPAVVPALVTGTEVPRTSPNRVAAFIGPGLALPLRPTIVSVLPRVGDAGVVLSRAWLPASRPDGYDAYRANEVWLGAGAPADFPQRLAAAGLLVSDVQSAPERADALGAQGPNFAVRWLVLGAGAAGLLAVAGATTSLLVASRRRLYEMAAIRSLGVRPARVVGSLVLEQLAISGAAAVVGLGAGLIGARVALARLPEFADRPAFPALLLDVPVLLCVVLVLAVVAAVTLAAALGGVGLVRQASPSRLREAQG